MYLASWIFLLGLSVWLGLAAFIWSLQTGQFSNQERARYLPLADGLEPAPQASQATRTGLGAYLLVLIIVSGLMFIGAGLVLGIYHSLKAA